jgi:SAM-dependent methyltransferase
MSTHTVVGRAREVRMYQRILSRVGAPLQPDQKVLDFGCGRGEVVEEFLSEGYDAFGCDIELARETDRLRLIDAEPYRVPFDDDAFDFVVSEQVFEHVHDFDQAVREIARVLRPGGVSLHVFPSRYRPIECPGGCASGHAPGSGTGSNGRRD